MDNDMAKDGGTPEMRQPDISGCNTMKKRMPETGVLSREDYRKRTIAIARGEYMPRTNEPGVWFESMGSPGQVPCGRNQELPRPIRARHPSSLTALVKTRITDCEGGNAYVNLNFED